MNDYIKVIGPSIWMIMGAIIIFLIGIIVWGVMGKVHTATKTIAFVKDGLAICYVDQDTVYDIDATDELRVGGELADIISVSTVPIQANGVYDAGILAEMGLSGLEMLYPVTARSTLPDGSYAAEVIVEQIHPMSFITGEDN